MLLGIFWGDLKSKSTYTDPTHADWGYGTKATRLKGPHGWPPPSPASTQLLLCTHRNVTAFYGWQREKGTGKRVCYCVYCMGKEAESRGEHQHALFPIVITWKKTEFTAGVFAASVFTLLIISRALTPSAQTHWTGTTLDRFSYVVCNSHKNSNKTQEVTRNFAFLCFSVQISVKISWRQLPLKQI